jgi:hypothetical protein
VSAELQNAGSSGATVTTQLVLTDPAGSQVASCTGGPFDLAAGAKGSLRTTCTAPVEEGGYDWKLVVTHGGTEVGTASGAVDVTTGWIAALDSPAIIVPGAPAVIQVVYANARKTAVEVELGLSIRSEAGEPVETLTPLTISVPAEGKGTIVFSWDARSVTLGRYQVKATATPAGGVQCWANRVVDVRSGRPVRRHLTSGD